MPLLNWLNTENIERSTADVEWHPLRPFLPANAHVLFLGSFPPPRRRWCMDFYYPNWLNDHWRIEGAVFYNDKDYFVEPGKKAFRLADIVTHCERHGIAFFDTSTAIRRLAGNASDKFLEVVEPTDVKFLMSQLPQLRAIVTTGEKATETLCQQLGIGTPPQVNTSTPIPNSQQELYRLPSSSRAYPLPLEKKAAAYRAMFERYL